MGISTWGSRTVGMQKGGNIEVLCNVFGIALVLIERAECNRALKYKEQQQQQQKLSTLIVS